MVNGRRCHSAFVRRKKRINDHFSSSTFFFSAKKRCKPMKLFPSNAVLKTENLLLFHNDPEEILVGSTMTFECLANYAFDTTSNTTSTIRCQNDGTWATIGHCRLAMDATCDYSKLYLPARSRITRMNFQFSESNRQYHQVSVRARMSSSSSFIQQFCALRTSSPRLH